MGRDRLGMAGAIFTEPCKHFGGGGGSWSRIKLTELFTKDCKVYERLLYTGVNLRRPSLMMAPTLLSATSWSWTAVLTTRRSSGSGPLSVEMHAILEEDNVAEPNFTLFFARMR